MYMYIYIYKSQGGIPSKCESSARPEYAPALCKSVMPLEFLGCARATLALSMRLWLGMIIIIMIKIMIKHIYIHIYIYICFQRGIPSKRESSACAQCAPI